MGAARDNPTDAARGAASGARRDAEHGRGWFSITARAGLIAKGISYAIVGGLALKLALQAGGKATSRQGALATLADESWGKVALVLLALGFLGYVVWRFSEAILGSGEDKTHKEWGKRAGAAGRGAIYVGLAIATAQLVFGGGGGGSQNQEARQRTADVLGWPAGKWIVLAAGLAVIAAGAWNAYRGLSQKFSEPWRAMSQSARRWGCRVGIAGHLARGVVFTLIGVFFVKAALEYEPKEAVGLDGALQEVANASHGRLLLGVVAVGLLAYAVYCFVDARYRDVSVGD